MRDALAELSAAVNDIGPDLAGGAPPAALPDETAELIAFAPAFLVYTAAMLAAGTIAGDPGQAQRSRIAVGSRRHADGEVCPRAAVGNACAHLADAVAASAVAGPPCDECDEGGSHVH